MISCKIENTEGTKAFGRLLKNTKEIKRQRHTEKQTKGNSLIEGKGDSHIEGTGDSHIEGKGDSHIEGKGEAERGRLLSLDLVFNIFCRYPIIFLAILFHRAKNNPTKGNC